jgi:tight adherence protein C
MESVLLITVLIFFATLLFAVGVYFYFQYLGERRRLIEKIKSTEKSPASRNEASGTGIYAGSLKRNLVDITSYLGNLLKPKKEDDINYIQKKLARAGYRDKNATTIYYGLKVSCAAALPAAFYLFKILTFKIMPYQYFMAILVILAIIGFYLPNVLLNNQIARRKETLLAGFPEALDLMVVCVEAGIGMDSAVSRVGEEMKLTNKPLSEEFRLMNLELRAGKSRRDALKNLAMRTDLEEISSLTTLLIQTDKFGTSVGPALRVHSDGMRTRRYQKAEELAAKLPVKLVVPLIFCIFPALFVVIMGPSIIQAIRLLSSR